MATKFSEQQTGVISGLKERFGFGKKKDQYEQGEYGRFDDPYDEGYGEYEDSYDENYDSYDDDYAQDNYDGNHGGSRALPDASSSLPSSPRLITLDDVKASTSKMMAEQYGTEKAPSRKRITVSQNDAYDQMANAHITESRGGSSAGAGRSSAGGSGAGAGRSSAGSSAASSASAGVSSAGASNSGAGAYGSSAGRASAGGQSAGGRSSHSQERGAGFNSLFTPSTAQGGQSRRDVQVIRPQSYNDVAVVADVLRNGGAVVLYLAQTPKELQPRVLDFSFGVASALDAHVDSLGAGTYVVTCGSPLSSAERASLASQGIM